MWVAVEVQQRFSLCTSDLLNDHCWAYVQFVYKPYQLMDKLLFDLQKSSERLIES